MPMNPRLLRPIASGVHPDAAAWRSAVVANGGSVSASTMKAVSTFCAAINAASLRDLFYRLNLFAGTGLNAALVPLYRGPSRTGTQYGNATDTNVGPFVSGDYSESTGLSGGSASSNKYLNTGLSPDDIGALTQHFSYYHIEDSPLTNQRPIGVFSVGNNLFLSRFSGSPVVLNSSIAGSAQVAASTGLAGLNLIDRSSDTSLKLYIQGAEIDSSTVSVAGSVLPAIPYFVFNNNANGAPTANQYWPSALRAYSIGLSIGDSGASAYSTAMTALQTALGRNV